MKQTASVKKKQQLHMWEYSLMIQTIKIPNKNLMLF